MACMAEYKEKDLTSSTEDCEKNFGSPSEATSSDLQGPTHQHEVVSGKELSKVGGEPASFTRHQAMESNTDLGSTDSYLQPVLQKSYFLEETTMGINSSEIIQTDKIWQQHVRIQCDDSVDVDPFTIQYVDDKAKPPRYLRLDDDHYKIDVINGLPDPEVSGFMDPKCVFNRIPKPSHPHASLLKVMKFYVVLDTSSSPPSSLKLVMDEPSPDLYDASLVYREGVNEKWVLYFKYKKMVYVIKPENRILTIEEYDTPIRCCPHLWYTSTPPAP